MNRTIRLISCGLLLALGACGGDTGPEPLFQPKPECEGQAVAPLQGQHANIISFLEVGAISDGFDLDGDGEPDNKLGAVSSLAGPAIEDALEEYSILIPFEFFDFESPGVDECVKFAIYLGEYKRDDDMDMQETAEDGGDCNDHDDAINDNLPEILGNYKDDNCNGLADEEVIDGNIVPSDNIDDMDQDGRTIADGDCDDTNAMIGGDVEICGDGLDNECDGNADYGIDGEGNYMCNPLDDTPDMVGIDPLSLNPNGSPVIVFDSGVVREVEGRLQLEAGPSIFGVSVPVTDDIALELRITGATIVGDMVETAAGWTLQNARLGGVIDAYTADQIRGLEVEQIGLEPENSLLDAIFANLLGALLALDLADANEYSMNCRSPDIDVDRDGLEAFCDSNPLDDNKTVDVCVDGDGTIILDEVDGDGNVITHCSEAVDENGNQRFVDGISVELNFATTPTILPESL